MKFHEILLLTQLLSFLGFFKIFRKVLLVALPLLISWFGFICPDYTEYIIGNFGVKVGIDSFSRYLIIISSLMFTVIFIQSINDKLDFSKYFFYITSVFVLNFIFTSKDLFNIYILLELLSILAVLMMIENADKKKLWASIKYLLIGNVGANVYLLGVLIYYLNTGSFHITKNAYVPNISVNLMTLGLLIRTGVFGFGMWLPQFHSTADKNLSAMFSGIYINSGVYALKLINDVKSIEYMVPLGLILSLAAAILGFLSKDVKRTIALSTMNHLGIMIINPANSLLYIMAHSIAKTLLFLVSDDLKMKEMNISIWLVSFVSIASLSGFPMTLGSKAEHILTASFPLHLTLLILISNSIIGAALFKHIWKKPKKGFSKLLIVALSLIHITNFNFLTVIGIIITLMLSLFKPRKTIHLPIESMDMNLLFVLGMTVVILWLF
ncbi:MAG: hypothetical protein J7L34_08885 [Thermotogaceae bacterium]|nr:hypothetical protein [Thermotogaceae bacterium]